MGSDRSERGRPASFDRESGAVRGSGSGAGGEGNPNEDYDADATGGGGAPPVGATGSGHPLPGSGEARHREIPERAEREKGRGDDAAAVNQPAGEAVAPDGEPYRYDDLGRGPGSGDRSAGAVGRDEDELARDQGEHQDRGQSIAAAESDRD